MLAAASAQYLNIPDFMYIIMHITTGSIKGGCCLQQIHEGLHPCKTLITSRAKETKHSKQEEVRDIFMYMYVFS